MALGKASTWVDRPVRTFQEEVAGALDGKEFSLVACGSADNSIKLNATVGTAIGVFFEKLQSSSGNKDNCNVRMFGGPTQKVIQNAAINYGARVMEDSGAPTKVKAVPGTTGTYISRGRKISEGGGAGGDIIEITNCCETVVVP